MHGELLKQADQWEVRARRRIEDAQRLYKPESMEYRAMFNGAMIYRNCAEEVRVLAQAFSSTHPSATQEATTPGNSLASHISLKLSLSDDLAKGLEALSALFKQSGDGISDELLCRINRLLASLADCDLTAAPGTSPDVVVLQLPVVWLDELRAIAASAGHIE